jgi:hypothetical protein
MSKEAVVYNFKVLPKHLPGGTEENNEKPQDSRDPGPSEYKAGFLTTRPRPSVVTDH